MSLGRCRICARCAGGRRCPFQDGETKGCSKYIPKVNPYSENVKAIPGKVLLKDEHWSRFKKVDIDDKGDG